MTRQLTVNKVIRDRNNLEWVRLKKYCEDRLAELREENDGDRNEVETSKIRGMIEFAKEILDLDDADIERLVGAGAVA